MHTTPLHVPGAALPALGLGTWRMGESSSRCAAGVASLRLALDADTRAMLARNIPLPQRKRLLAMV